ncbi:MULTISPECIES: M24 family metallopeptidase [unclassified Aureimonas]|uniref:M24 family metallopeptidase n=1 Tax=unclassified Aureimonas TaxID=2615206 RepID=UPI0006F567D3|nr:MULTISPECIES: M24 family metallopeptidase [unclassified Aureimonas]KQT60640.1 dipeptidase [Aureimonas sp. Leaf460]KQT68769.1 dipeptidase [Aureimonas sp. Leaf427]
MSAAAGPRIVPPWTYRPGPDVAIEPPPGLVKAQDLAKGAAAAGIAALLPGVTEREIELAIGAYLAAEGVAHVWTITNVGLGENARICFPTHPPTDLAASERDLVMIDVHPITAEGFWGDCTRCGIVGDYPEARKALADLTAIHRETLAKCRPGMPANVLFGLSEERLTAEGFVLLDLLANIGHSLTPGAAYLHQFIDAGNDTAMWGAWAVEPFVSRDGVAVKVEDLVWFGRDACTVL